MAAVDAPREGVSAVKRRTAVRRMADVRWLRRVMLSRVVATPGYWFATMSGLVWGGVLSRFRLRREAGLVIAEHLPQWAFGRGGTTIGGVFLTADNVTPSVLEHEAVHKEQWRRYGLAFILLYVDAGRMPTTNRFEVEAGLKKGGYV